MTSWWSDLFKLFFEMHWSFDFTFSSYYMEEFFNFRKISIDFLYHFSVFMLENGNYLNFEDLRHKIGIFLRIRFFAHMKRILNNVNPPFFWYLTLFKIPPNYYYWKYAWIEKKEFNFCHMTWKHLKLQSPRLVKENTKDRKSVV